MSEPAGPAMRTARPEKLPSAPAGAETLSRPLLWLVLLLPSLACLPALATGYTREDWLLLWWAQDPASAPPGAAGAFSRPLAQLLWRAVVTIAGAEPVALHAVALALSLLLALATARLALRLPGAGPWHAIAAAAVVGAHGALVEAHLWAAAVNGLLAAAMAAWGAELLLPPPGPSAAARGSRRSALRPGAGVLLLALAGLARADAWSLLLLPVFARLRPDPGGRRGVGWGVALAGTSGVSAAALIWTAATGGGPTFHPEHAGLMLQRLILPWGPPLPSPIAAGVGIVSVPLLALAGLRHRAPLVGGGLLLIAGVAGGAALVPWAPAGRYLLVPAIGLALAAAHHLAPRLPHRPARTPRFAAGLLVAAWLLAGTLGAWFGGTARRLTAAARAETALYRVVAPRAGPLAPATIVLVGAPRLGWTGSEADASNVVSAALRRRTPVVLAPAGSRQPQPAGARPAAAIIYRDGEWTWDDAERSQRTSTAAAEISS